MTKEFTQRCEAVGLKEGSLFTWLEKVEMLQSENTSLKEQVAQANSRFNQIRITRNQLLEELTTLQSKSAALKEQVAQLGAFGDTAKHLLSELLAVLHGDGGHHEDRVGTAQAVGDAMKLHYSYVETITTLQSTAATLVDALEKIRKAARLGSSVLAADIAVMSGVALAEFKGDK